MMGMPASGSSSPWSRENFWVIARSGKFHSLSLLLETRLKLSTAGSNPRPGNYEFKTVSNWQDNHLSTNTHLPQMFSDFIEDAIPITNTYSVSSSSS